MTLRGARATACMGVCFLLELACQRTPGPSETPSAGGNGAATAGSGGTAAAGRTGMPAGSGGVSAGAGKTGTAGSAQPDAGTEDGTDAGAGGRADEDAAAGAAGEPPGDTGGGPSGGKHDPSGVGGSAAGRTNDEASGGKAGHGQSHGGRGGLGSVGGLGGAAPQGGASANGGAGTTAEGGSGGNAAGAGGAGSGSDGSGGNAAGAGGGSPAGCSFDVTAALSAAIPTVAGVEFSTTLPDVASAEIAFTLEGELDGVQNRGGIAPVDLAQPSYRTLLLGLKPGRTYSFSVRATSSAGVTCRSEDHELTTGALLEAPAISRTVYDSANLAGGFVITSGGFNSTVAATIIDADGDVVWAAPAPPNCSRARFDYEGKNMWMLAANPSNNGGDLRYVSLDGTTSGAGLDGLGSVHHDFVALPGGAIAVFAWSKSGTDPESDLLLRAADGSVNKLFHVGSNLYAGGPSAFGGSQHSYHCNSLAYHASDDSFTIGDRNPSSFVKVSHDGRPLWQFGGSCAGAKAPRCVAGSWQINHGHQLLDDGTFLFFNNTSYGSSGTPSNIDEFMLSAGDAMSAASVKQWIGGGREHSDTLGDVQRLPNGNTLVTFSNNGVIYELDPSWNVVATLRAASFGYSEWRAGLYGPPTR